ncbi:MAG TPA: Yip1 family protein [Gemmatimonadales bacterium]|nr:Yip1 family protein [Gemmatimonadales bacterium]
MNLVDRVKRILLSPRTEWEIIDNEPSSPAQLFTSYAVPLAAIGPVAQIIGYSVLGFPVPFGGNTRMPLGSAITAAIVTYVLILAATYLLGLIIDALAPTFSGQRSQIQGLKLAVYSSTAAWIAGFFHLLPGLRFLLILGLYSVYLLYLGIPVLMKTPPHKTIAYTAVVVVAAIVLFVVNGFVAGHFVAVPTAGWTVP